MFKQFIQYVPGADGFMIASLAVFLGFFIAVGIYLLTADKGKMDDMAQMPLGNDNQSNG
jgi:cbb3-type cytochrome oxidase subunit 3